MVEYVARRIGQAVFVVWAAFTLTFVLLYVMPSDPVEIMLGGGAGDFVDPVLVEELRQEHGLDQPLAVQYVSRLLAAAQGDFGNSIQTGAPVLSSIVEAFPHTLALSAAALVLALSTGLALAVAAACTNLPALRSLLLSLPPVGVSIPVFWAGLVLLQVVSFQWGLLPSFGNDGWQSLVLPAITLALPSGAIIAQVLASGLVASWDAAYVETVRAKGAGRVYVLTRHALRNSTVPLLTLVGVTVGNLLAGSVVVETVFARAGIGRLTQAAVMAQDIPTVQGIVVMSAVVFALVSLAVDLVYPLVDPRIRLQPVRRAGTSAAAVVTS